MTSPTITIEEYLNRKGILFRKANGELITACLFNGCDKDSKGREAHLYFSAATGQYNCKKCNAQGNLFTLAKHFGDAVESLSIEQHQKPELKLLPAPKLQPAVDEALIESYHNALPDNIRKYLNDRGLPNDTINDFKVGWGEFYGEYWIAFPIRGQDGQCLYFKLRQDPAKGKDKMTSQKGVTAQIYPWKTVQQAEDFIVICEGECDALLLQTQGIPAVTSTHGAATFKEGWAREFQKFEKTYVCYDRDSAGEKGSQHVIELLQAANCKSVFLISLPEEVGDGGDVTDYFTKLGGNPDDFFGKLAKAVPNPNAPHRVKSFPLPHKQINFTEWQSIIVKNFPELAFAAKTALAILCQLLINDITNPFGLVLVDSPASGKTITINFFDDIEGVTYASDKFTPASFVSNSAKTKKEDLPEIDLLPRIQYKMFLVRDFATLFSKREEDLKDILGTLTRVLDGEGFSADTGVHGQRGYKGEYLFMMLAASTPIPPRVWKTMGTLGGRLFFLQLHTKDKTDEQLISQLTGRNHKLKEIDCREATQNFIRTLWNLYPQGVEWNAQGDDQKLLFAIVQCARLLSRLRGVVEPWRYKDDEGEEYKYNQPIIEKPDRINQLLYNLARGHALIQGRVQISEADLKPVIEVTLDSASSTRSQLFRALLENKGIMNTTGVMAALNCSRPTALNDMKALELLGVCRLGQPAPKKDDTIISVVSDLHWFFSDNCKKIRCLTPPA